MTAISKADSESGSDSDSRPSSAAGLVAMLALGWPGPADVTVRWCSSCSPSGRVSPPPAHEVCRDVAGSGQGMTRRNLTHPTVTARASRLVALVGWEGGEYNPPPRSRDNKSIQWKRWREIACAWPGVAVLVEKVSGNAGDWPRDSVTRPVTGISFATASVTRASVHCLLRRRNKHGFSFRTRAPPNPWASRLKEIKLCDWSFSEPPTGRPGPGRSNHDFIWSSSEMFLVRFRALRFTKVFPFVLYFQSRFKDFFWIERMKQIGTRRWAHRRWRAATGIETDVIFHIYML